MNRVRSRSLTDRYKDGWVQSAVRREDGKWHAYYNRTAVVQKLGDNPKRCCVNALSEREPKRNLERNLASDGIRAEGEDLEHTVGW